MAPRKVGTTRMDAALDAMGEMGYPKKQVRSMMHKLLKVYGGIQGYRLIEDCGYSVLRTALLDDEEEKKLREAQSAEVEALTKGDSADIQRVGDNTAGPSGQNVGSFESHPVYTHFPTELATTEGDADRGGDTCSQAVDGTAGGEDHLHGLLLLASCASSLKPQSGSTRKRSPGNGLIEDDDDVADDRVSIPPAVNVRPTPLPVVQLRRSKRNKKP